MSNGRLNPCNCGTNKKPILDINTNDNTAIAKCSVCNQERTGEVEEAVNLWNEHNL